MARRRWFLGGPRSLGVGLVLFLALAPVGSVHAVGTHAAPPATRAELNGHPIALPDVSRFHCHDLASPLIRCFGSAAARDADEAAMAAMSAGQSGTKGATSSAITPYVRWYLDANYGGPSFDASVTYRDLGVIGWNDKISSFLTYAGGHPRWWRDVGFTGSSPTTWCNTRCNASLAPGSDQLAMSRAGVTSSRSLAASIAAIVSGRK